MVSPAWPAVISVEDLRVRYDDNDAVDGISFDVHAGEVVALLGPNGAGKTTTVEVLEGHRRRTAGEVDVLGASFGVLAAWTAGAAVMLRFFRWEPSRPTIRRGRLSAKVG